MRNLIFFSILLIGADCFAQQMEYKVITSIESIVPMGIGRSRLIASQSEVNPDLFTTERDNGKKSRMGKVRRKDLKIDEFEETKMLNFYSATGINFQNVASNDALVSSKLTMMSLDGWTLAFVLSGVESDAGSQDGNGIYITRYIFQRPYQEDSSEDSSED